MADEGDRAKAPEPANNEPAPGPNMEEPKPSSQPQDKKAPDSIRKPRKPKAAAKQAEEVKQAKLEPMADKPEADTITVPRALLEQMQKARVDVDIHQPHRETVVQVYDLAPDGSRVPSTRITLRGPSDRIGTAVDAGLQTMLREAQ